MRRCTGSSLLLGLLGPTGCLTTRPNAPGQAVAPRSSRPLEVAKSANAIWLEELGTQSIDQDWGKPHVGQSVDGHPMALAGLRYEHGIGTHADSEMTVLLHGGARRFEALVGVDDETHGKGSVVFIVEADDRELVRSRTLHGSDQPQKLFVELGGAQRLTLRAVSPTDSNDDAHADWAAALIVLDPNASVKPTMWIPDPGPEPVIAPVDDQELAIHAPYITGATAGRTFLFRIPASGIRPIRFAAEGLPEGLILDAETGIISGSLHRDGRTDVHVSAQDTTGHTSSTLTIVAGPHTLAQTPPMGWNSWNCWGTSVDDAKVRAAADALVRTGLADRGFQFVNIDDAWEAGRDSAGHIRSNKKFPDMKALADYVHARGLKLGIYSSPGCKTCAEYEGSYRHEIGDARTWGEWGVDLIKYDWCSYQKIAPKRRPEEVRAPYRLMREALDASGRDIVFSMCQYGMGNVWEWGAEVGGNYWRTTGDITDNWRSMSLLGFGQVGHEEFAAPGHWNDPDMLVVGSLGWSDKLHPTNLTRNE